jgi:hypothetical protein
MKKNTGNAVPPEILAEHLNIEQAAQVRRAIAAITDLDPSVIEACDYSNAELVDLFNRASLHHNKIAENFSKLDAVSRTNSFRTGGDYSRSVSVNEYGVDAVKCHARIDHYNHGLTRLAQGITTRALLRAGGRAP